MPVALERKLFKHYRKKGLKGKRLKEAVYATMNKIMKMKKGA